MLMEYAPTILDELDHYNIDRKCWMCAHFQQWNSAPDRCDSDEMKQAVMDLTGVNFVDLVLPVTHKTDASLCSEFCLSQEECARLEVLDMIQDARIEAQRHADHYRKLRREYA